MPDKKLVVLDRDGVINFDSEDYIKAPEEWFPIPGSLEAIARLKKSGYLVAIATNQSGVARGLYDLAGLEAIHEKMNAMLAALGVNVDLIAFCPHGPNEGCQCRKPKPGLLDEIAETLGVDLRGVPIIGDSARDLEAGLARNMLPIIVKTGNGADTIASKKVSLDTLAFGDLSSAVDFLLSKDARQ